jgi:hypothetical protein
MSEQRRLPDRWAASPRTWVLGGLVALLALLLCGLWGLYLFRGRLASGGPTPTPIIWTPSPAPSPTPPPTATAEPLPTASPAIAVGDYVQVMGTEGFGLNLREGPGTNYPRVDTADEGEVFVVVEGPTVAGGLPWWRLRAPDDPAGEAQTWWAAGNFLAPVEQP